MGYKYYIIDSFTDVAFGGVPVAVFPEADLIPDAYHKALSEEVVASDTVFIKNADTEAHRYSFLSYNEKGACIPGAHTMLAGIAALVNHHNESAEQPSAIKIDTTEDCIDAFVDPLSSRYPYVLKRKLNPTIDHFVPRNDEISSIIGLSGEDIATQKYRCAIAHCDTSYLFVPLMSYHAVREAEFINSAWSASSLPASLVDKVIVFAPNTDKSGADFHMRLLTRTAPPKADPAIGEAMPAFAGYLCDQVRVQKGTHCITIRRGENHGRQSFIQLEIDNTGTLPIQVRIGGSAVLTATGEIVTGEQE